MVIFGKFISSNGPADIYARKSNAGRICPIDAERQLYNTLNDIRQRGYTCLIFHRGLDGISNAVSLHNWVCLQNQQSLIMEMRIYQRIFTREEISNNAYMQQIMPFDQDLTAISELPRVILYRCHQVRTEELIMNAVSVGRR
jgi:hypothetical protein